MKKYNRIDVWIDVRVRTGQHCLNNTQWSMFEKIKRDHFIFNYDAIIHILLWILIRHTQMSKFMVLFKYILISNKSINIYIYY